MTPPRKVAAKQVGGSPPGALEQLAARCGVERQFRDARGDIQTASADTQRALLAAMGVDATDDAQAEAVLRELDRQEWGTALPPICVLRAGDEPFCVNLNLACKSGDSHSSAAAVTTVEWHIALEDGGERRGEAAFDSLQLVERYESAATLSERRRLILTDDLPLGYHTLTVEPGGQVGLIVSPRACWLPTEMESGKRLWGVSAQLYLLRSEANWGIGDYQDLRELVRILAERGASVVGLNPLHAMFLDAPDRASPYSPLSRLLLNVLNIDVAGLALELQCDEAGEHIAAQAFQRELRVLRAAQELDYSRAVSLKLPVLRLVFATIQSHRDAAHWQSFVDFRLECASTVERGSLFQALREHFAARGAEYADWHAWPEEYRDPASPAVERFGVEHADLVTFHAWLQFVADRQLAAAARAAEPMAVGLYRDLAVGADRSGAETWANQRAVVGAAQVGAPPDIYNPAGQDWGLPPFNPRALHEEGYRSFIELVRTNMRHAGGLRIDHVMALQQLYWVPQGSSPAEGAYVRYPLSDLVAILALESHRNRCLVVGEDLGTVPEGFRERMADANILSYRVLFFEKDEDGFISPELYPTLALAVAGSHDLPTLRGWWEAGDIELKNKLNLFPKPEDARRAVDDRAQDHAQILRALRTAGVVGSGEMTADELILAAHAYLARTTSALAVAQIDDIMGEAAPVNVPTTSDEHPNWRRRLSVPLDRLATYPRFVELATLFEQERGAAGEPEATEDEPA